MKIKNIFILIFALIFCLPTGTFAGTVYNKITASVPVTFFTSRASSDSIAVMEAINEAPEPYENEIFFAVSGTDAFYIDISEPGTYRYKVYQKQGTQSNTVYDDTIYSVIVFVTADSDDSLKYAVTATASDTGRKLDKIEFKNDVKSEGDSSSKTDSSSASGGGRNRSGSGKSTSLNKGKISTTVKTTDDSEDKNTNIPTDSNNSDQVSENNAENDSPNNNSENNGSEDKDVPTLEDELGYDSADKDLSDSGNLTYYDKNNENDDNITIEKNTPTITAETVVNTGDNTNQPIWIALMCISFLVIVFTHIAERFNKAKKGKSKLMLEEGGSL